MNLTFWMEEIVMFCHELGATGWVSTLGAAEVSLVVVGGSHAAAAFMTSLPQRVIDCLNTSFETTPPIRCKGIFRSVFICFIHYFTWVTQKKHEKILSTPQQRKNLVRVTLRNHQTFDWTNSAKPFKNLLRFQHSVFLFPLPPPLPYFAGFERGMLRLLTTLQWQVPWLYCHPAQRLQRYPRPHHRP